MAGNAVAQTTKIKHPYSVADLRIYQLALELEEKVYKLAKGLGTERFDVGNRLRRAGAGTPHYIFEFSRRYAYRSKIDALHDARAQAEEAIKILEDLGGKETKQLIEDYTILVKQTWGLIKYLRQKLAETQTATGAKAVDKLVTARPENLLKTS